MITGDIQHSDLPDELLHEPKGASKAGVGEVYVANGAGAGSFQKLPVSSIDVAIPSVPAVSPVVVSETVSLNGLGLAQPSDGILTDVSPFVGIPQEITLKINKNASELLRLYNNQKAINEELTRSTKALEDKLEEVITALKGLGLFDE